jgi:hypothetical protein
MHFPALSEYPGRFWSTFFAVFGNCNMGSEAPAPTDLTASPVKPPSPSSTNAPIEAVEPLEPPTKVARTAWWKSKPNVKPTVLQQWRLRSPFCMNHCAPRVIAECGAHKCFFACTRTRSGPFSGDPDKKAPRRPTLSGGTPEPFLDKLRKSLNQISDIEEPCMEPTSKWLFVSGFLNGSPQIAQIGTPVTLEAHNFASRPPIELRSEVKL